ncbi:4'-phosphopantetheinyl transferase superfamily protein [Ornithinibacillus scapharcae]|uniref:4'-phosphopantetheinyl transferase superfamily protein n=1 Tax=Ornithinibacillus scapharcae TaxID=1147159 RepID=UPI000225AB9A|nr:4'-phosphopantetheinyl transferase superfamily protein [Ornithinibacillus scapharcae]
MEFSITVDSLRNGAYIPVKFFFYDYENVTEQDYLNAKNTLGQEEVLEYSSYQVEKRKSEFLFGRYAGKRASADLIGEPDLKKIQITRGVFHQPVLMYEKNKDNIQVSITHTERIAAAISFPERHPFSVDLEYIKESNAEFLSSFIKDAETNLFHDFNESKIQTYTLIWSAKEALSKILKTGLTVSAFIYDLQRVREHDGIYTSEFQHFSQYKVIGFRIGNYICSICLPKNTVIKIDQISKKKLEDYLLLKKQTTI